MKVRDLVLRVNEVSHIEPRGRLGPTWEVPYRKTTAHHNGSNELETMYGRPIPRT